MMVNILAHLFSKALLAGCTHIHLISANQNGKNITSLQWLLNIKCQLFLYKARHLFPSDIGILEDGVGLNGGEQNRDWDGKVRAPGSAA